MRESGFRGQRAGKANILNLKKLLVPLGNEGGRPTRKRGLEAVGQSRERPFSIRF